MLYKVFDVDELVDLKNSDYEMIDLMENNGSHLKLIGLKKHEEIEAHLSHTNACIYLIDGEIEFIFNLTSNCTCSSCECEMDENEEDCKKFKIKKEQFFMFEKDIMHAIKALKDSVFLLIKI